MKYVVIVGFLCVAFVSARDQEKWIKQAEINANKDLEKWPEIAAAIRDNSPGANESLKEQLDFLKWQVKEAADNMYTFVPRLKWVVNQIANLANGRPNIFRRPALRAIVCFMTGKRDDKSYYMFDGAANWIKLRLDDLNDAGARGKELQENLTKAKKEIEATRDELDSGAQVYVKQLAEIKELNSDIRANIVKIREIANDMATAFNNSPLLLNTKKTVHFVENIN